MRREFPRCTLGRRTKLSDADIELIREAYALKQYYLQEAQKLSNDALAKKFNVSPTTISAVIHRTYSYLSAKLNND